MIPIKTPNILKYIFSGYNWDFSSKNSKKIYLTFDDGPIPDVTEFVLKELSKYNAKATFFCIGDNIKKHPAIFNKILSYEHAIGNHTMNHLKAWKNDSKTYIDNVLACSNEIEHFVDPKKKEKLFRPPYGQISYPKFKTLQNQGYKIIMWNILSKDWDQKTSPEQCFQNVIQNAQQGSIIVFHDSIKAAINLKYALPKVLEYYTEKGYTFEKINF